MQTRPLKEPFYLVAGFEKVNLTVASKEVIKLKRSFKKIIFNLEAQDRALKRQNNQS